MRSKISEEYIYLKCALFRVSCKGTGRLNKQTNLITPLHNHNHQLEDYKTDIFRLKTKCKTLTKQSQNNLRKVFDEQQEQIPVHAKFLSGNANQPSIVREGSYIPKSLCLHQNFAACYLQQLWENSTKV